MIRNNLREVIEEVRKRVDIVDVVGDCISLDQNLKALCPFHEDTNPSFSVNPTGQYFHCFGCGVGGDVFDFLMLHEERDFMTVLHQLAKKAGISLPHFTPEDRLHIEEKRTKEDILTAAADFYHKCITPEAIHYLTDARGITKESIERFKIGFAQGGLLEHLTEKLHYELELCLKAGVLKRAKDGSIKDFFYNRVVFPNIKRGRVVHMSGRSLDDKDPKYLHLPGKIQYLYNEDVLSKNELCVVEGIPDCISAVQAAYPAVATYGAGNFKREYVAKFSRQERVYLCLDGDDAGREGALKIGGLIGERARIVQLPDGLDLNDYFRSFTVDDFEKLVASSQDVVKYQLSLISPDTDKIELPQRLDPVLKGLAQMDKAKVEAYLRYEIKKRFGLKKEDVEGYRELVNKFRKEYLESEKDKAGQDGGETFYTAYFDGLVDLVDDNGHPAFLIKGNDKLSIVQQIERDGRRHEPPPRGQIPWLLPRGEQVLEHYKHQISLSQLEADGDLYDDLVAHHKSISELPSEGHYDLLAAWDFHTYLQEPVQYTPVICLFAVPERGKSRTGKGMIYVAYHGIHVESLRDAYLLRAAHDLKATIFFDVKDIWRKAEKNGSEDILLHRYERGANVPRVLYPDRGPHQDTVYYTVFGPTVIGTNEGVHRILETRAIQISMPETSKRFENDVTPESALELKERLLAFRARHLDIILPAVNKPASGRLGDILKPLQQITRLVKPEKEPSFLQLVRNLEDERLIEKSDSFEAKILEVILSLENEVVGGMLPIKGITDELNEDRSEKSKVSYQRVGWRLKAMGFEKAKTGEGSSAILWDEEKIGGMEKAYGLKRWSETPETPESPAAEPGVSGNTGDPGDLFKVYGNHSPHLFGHEGGDN